MPFYSSVDLSNYYVHRVDFLQNIPILFGDRYLTISVLTTRLPGSEVDVYFIDCPEMYHRGSIYTSDPDEHLRFAVLSRATIECCQRMGWGPDIMHCNDWQTALIPLYLKRVYNWDGLFSSTRTVLTIHNIAYQGAFPASALGDIGLDNYRDLLDQADLQYSVVNSLKTGIIHADLITTVSRTYAREIQTPEGGAGLDSYLRERSDSVLGIVNGVDYDEWSPEADRYIPYRYSIDDRSGKERDKADLLGRLNLHHDLSVPLLGIVSRLADQKGFDLFYDTLDLILGRRNVSLAVLGSGEERYERFFQELQGRWPGRVTFYRGFSTELAHLIEAGSDIFLMPSKFEPCGLNQIYSLRYGTIPVVRKTGGLADTVEQFDAITGMGTGFVFERYSKQELYWAMEFALHTYQNKPVWNHIMSNAMSKNYSWDAQAQKYISAYVRLLTA
jgi:starch synthase